MNRRSDTMQLATEVALFGVTAAAIVGMHRLFLDGSFRWPLVFQAMAAHLTMALLRRHRVRLLPAALAAFAIGVVVITVTQYMSTAWIVIPSPDTLTAIRGDMDAAWAVFREREAPAPVEPGFVVATSMTVWVIAFVADWGAFRTGVSFEALLPPATLFLFASVLGAEGQRGLGAAVFVGAAMLFLLLHRTWRQEDSASWAALQQQRGRWSLVSTGLVLAVLSVVAGACVGPSLPGAGADPIFPWRDLGDQPEARVVLSPLVDIRGRLVEQSNLQVFTVQTDNGEGYYWRLTALDAFDGTIWKSTYDTSEADGELPESLPPETPAEVVRQDFTIQGLGQIWLPNAYAARSIDVENDMAVKFDEASGTLIVPADLTTSDDLQYTVESAVPNFSEALRDAPTDIPQAILDRYTQLPGDFSEAVTELAQTLALGAETQFDKAMELQRYLRGFEYTTDIQRGHGNNAMERFLLDRENGQRGYCEQFAASFAAMARVLGIPARVAVGFTEGDEDDNQPGLFRVMGRNAHAWPEVYFEGEGWVPFEPTPDRGPGNGDYLGIEEAQDDGDDEGPVGPQPGDSTTPTTPSPAPGQGSPTRPEDIGNEGVSVNDEPTGDEGRVRLEVPPVADVARPVGGLAVAYLLLVPLALVAVRQLRRARAREPGQKLDLAWVETNAHAEAAGIRLLPSLTVAERAGRLRTALPGVASDIDLLAASVERATYAEVPPTPDEIRDIAIASAAIASAAAQRRTLWNRIGAYLDARNLFPSYYRL
jgi:transglutaminase-like putative cysteine protease